MNAYRVVSLIIFLAILMIVYKFQIALIIDNINHSNISQFYFRADSDQLLNLHQIPELENPKERMKSMKAFNYQISKAERQTYYKLLSLFDRIMKEHGILYFVSSGTLLGSYRNHDILPWDDDIDVWVNLANRKQLEDLYKDLNMTNVELYHTSGHDKLFFNNESFSSSNYGWKWPYIDISFFDSNATHIIDIANTYGRYETVPKSIIFPLSTRPLFTFDVPSPKDAFAYCAWIFGYTDLCIMNSYSHIIEGSFSGYGTEKCSLFKDRYPYINRYLNNDGVVEELVYKNIVLQRILVNEPKYAIAESFSIKLQKGFQIPTDVELPLVK